MNKIFTYNLELTENHIERIVDLSKLLDLNPGKLIIKALENGLLELQKENKENYKCALYRALEETEEKLRCI